MAHNAGGGVVPEDAFETPCCAVGDGAASRSWNPSNRSSLRFRCWHQHRGLHLDLGQRRLDGEEVAVQPVVAVPEKHRRSMIAALGHMMRQVGDDDAGYAGHVGEDNGGQQLGK